MKTFLKYFYEVLSQFFSGFISIFNGIIDGFSKIFNFKAYIRIAKNYKGDFNISEWILFAISALILLVFIAMFVNEMVKQAPVSYFNRVYHVFI